MRRFDLVRRNIHLLRSTVLKRFHDTIAGYVMFHGAPSSDRMELLRRWEVVSIVE